MELRFQLFHILFGNVVALLVKAHVSYETRFRVRMKKKYLSNENIWFLFTIPIDIVLVSGVMWQWVIPVRMSGVASAPRDKTKIIRFKKKHNMKGREKI